MTQTNCHTICQQQAQVCQYVRGFFVFFMNLTGFLIFIPYEIDILIVALAFQIIYPYKNIILKNIITRHYLA